MKYLKIIYIFLIVFFFNTILNAQTTKVVTGIQYPNYLMLNGDDLYISQYDRISKINIKATNPTPKTIIQGGTYPIYGQMAVSGDFLYAAIQNEHKILKISTKTFAATDSITVDNRKYISGLALNNNDLYYAVRGTIFKVDINAISTNPITVATGLGNTSKLVIKGNYLYMIETTSDYSSSVISRLDITAPLPATTTEIISMDDPLSMVFYGNKLIVSSAADRIQEYDITNLSKAPKTLPSVPSIFLDLAIHESHLYLLEGFLDIKGRILKYQLTSDPSTNISVYPNPARRVINISGAPQGINYKIIKNGLNQPPLTLLNGNLKDNNQIDVGRLDTGVYTLSLGDNNNNFRFIKK